MLPARKLKQKYTYQDYLHWPDDERWEIIEGEPYSMCPAPSIKHQRISRNLERIIFNHLISSRCEAFGAPTDVVLDEFNVVQPDIFIVCDQNKITEKNIQGAPDLIIEIISKSTAYKDVKIKKELYEKFRVKEYIIVFPDLKIVERYILQDNNHYGYPEKFNWDEILRLETIDMDVNLKKVFII